jgi:hypothetical protein
MTLAKVDGGTNWLDVNATKIVSADFSRTYLFALYLKLRKILSCPFP